MMFVVMISTLMMLLVVMVMIVMAENDWSCLCEIDKPHRCLVHLPL